MASRETVKFVLEGFCLLWKRDYDLFVFEAYLDVCKNYDDGLVREVAQDLARTSEWFPLPVVLRNILAQRRDERAPKIAAESEVVVKASPETVAKFMAELAERGVIANAKPRTENGTGRAGRDADVGAASAEARPSDRVVDGE